MLSDERMVRIMNPESRWDFLSAHSCAAQQTKMWSMCPARVSYHRHLMGNETTTGAQQVADQSPIWFLLGGMIGSRGSPGWTEL